MSKIDRAVIEDEAAHAIVRFVCDKIAPKFRDIALERADLTAEELVQMGEEDDRNPRYNMYYSELNGLLMSVMGQAIGKMT